MPGSRTIKVKCERATGGRYIRPVSRSQTCKGRQWSLARSVRNWPNSPGHFHQGHGHSCGIDGQVSIQVYNEAEVEHVDADCGEITNRGGEMMLMLRVVTVSASQAGGFFVQATSPEPASFYKGGHWIDITNDHLINLFLQQHWVITDCFLSQSA